MIKYTLVGTIFLGISSYASAAAVTFNFTMEFTGVSDYQGANLVHIDPGLLDSISSDLSVGQEYSGSATIDTSAFTLNGSDVNLTVTDLTFNLAAPLNLDFPRASPLNGTFQDDLAGTFDRLSFNTTNRPPPVDGVRVTSLVTEISFLFPDTAYSGAVPPTTMPFDQITSAAVSISYASDIGDAFVNGVPFYSTSQTGVRTANFTITSASAVPEPSPFLSLGLVAVFSGALRWFPRTKP